jgi:Trk-type K+ transport systems, membrane components
MFNRYKKVIKKMIVKHPRRTIVLGFLGVIFLGAVLLASSASERAGNVSFINGLFMSTSAVCVTGLSTIDVADNFNIFGRTVLAVLIQIGGLGITSIGVITIMLAKGKVSLGGTRLAREAFNISSGKNLRALLRSIVRVELTVEGIGAVLSFIAFYGDFGFWKTVGISIFHSISAFNNAGFDLFGSFRGLAGYHDNILVVIVTSALIIIGGLGFFVNMEIITKRSFRKFSLHTKIVLCMTAFLIVSGTLLLLLTEHTNLYGAFFQSVTARTAGFATENIGLYSNAGLLVLIILMFIGASPGSTGGGIKTTTMFIIMKNMKSVAFNKPCTAFNRRISDDTIQKALVIATLGMTMIIISTLLISLFEPAFAFRQILTEVVSAFATVGLTTGITPDICSASKIILVITMFIGRVGPLTLITLWWQEHKPEANYTEEPINVG